MTHDQTNQAGVNDESLDMGSQRPAQQVGLEGANVQSSAEQQPTGCAGSVGASFVGAASRGVHLTELGRCQPRLPPAQGSTGAAGTPGRYGRRRRWRRDP